jgi:hypothetical protein
MSEETKNTPKLPEATPSYEALLQMLIKSQEAQADSNRLLAEAMLESRKPYVDPNVLKQKELALEERRAEIKRTQAIRIATKSGCPHIRDNGTSNIKWMQHSNNIVKGVCGSCFSEFDSRNQADMSKLRQDPKSIKSMGRAGNHAHRNMGEIG